MVLILQLCNDNTSIRGITRHKGDYKIITSGQQARIRGGGNCDLFQGCSPTIT